MSWLEDPLVRAFEAATVDGQAFGHREHLYVAFCYLKELPLEAALGRYVHHLQQLTRALGAPAKYHATMTWAYLVLLHEAMQDSEVSSGGFEALARLHPRLFDARAGALLDYYEPAELQSDSARAHFRLPSRLKRFEPPPKSS